MKRFNLRGNSANWGALKVSALNTKTEEHETSSEIPYGMKITVRVVNNYYRVTDKRVRQILHGEISTEDNQELISRLTRTHRPDFILFHNGEVVGTANYHRKGWLRREQEEAKRLKTYEVTANLTVTTKIEAHSEEEARQIVLNAVNEANEQNGAEEFSGKFFVANVYVERV